MKQAYDRDGYVIVPGLYSGGQMLEWKQALQAALQAERFSDPSGVRVWLGQALPQPVLAAMSDPHVVEILQCLIGPDIEFLSAKAVFKDGKTKFGSPWHQDWFYWEGAPKISVWIALDDATVENGCLTLAPGTHTRIFAKQVVDGAGFINRVRDEDLAAHRTLCAPVKRGDAIFFHDLLVHGSNPNTIGGDRWSLISTYRNGSVPDASKVWDSSLLICGRSVNGANA
jgi:hypothetical protein